MLTGSVTLRPRVALILTGGTIQAEGKNRLDLSAYMENGRRLTADELLCRVPELRELAEIETIQYSTGPSTALGEDDWLKLLRTVQEIAASRRADAVVITHGTNTLEETAYFLHLTLKTRIPLILVGAMRPATAIGCDGEANLVHALATAISADVTEMGVLVVMNGAIYSARDVTKGATYRVDAFSGGEMGPLGFVDGGSRVAFYHRPARPHTTATEFDARPLTALPPVAVMLSYTGANGALIDAAVDAGVQGIVIAGSGAAGVTPSQNDALSRAAERNVVVCLSSRVGSGRVLQRPGLSHKGFVTTDNLVPWKAKILLSLALTITRDPEAVQVLFDRY
jgi:L-asparaginase